MKKRAPTKIEKVKARATRQYAVLQLLHNASRQDLENERYRASKLEALNAALSKAGADKTDTIARKIDEITRLNTRISDQNVERDRLVAMLNGLKELRRS